MLSSNLVIPLLVYTLTRAFIYATAQYFLHRTISDSTQKQTMLTELCFHALFLYFSFTLQSHFITATYNFLKCQPAWFQSASPTVTEPNTSDSQEGRGWCQPHFKKGDLGPQKFKLEVTQVWSMSYQMPSTALFPPLCLSTYGSDQFKRSKQFPLASSSAVSTQHGHSSASRGSQLGLQKMPIKQLMLQ